MSYLRIDPDEDSAVALGSDSGGLAITNQAELPPLLGYEGDSVILGALSFAPGQSSTAYLSTLDYVLRSRNALDSALDGLPSFSLGATPFLALFGAGAIEAREEFEAESEAVLTRRQVVLGGLTAVGGAALSTSEAAAAEDNPTVTLAEMRVEQNPRGLTIGLSDDVADVLPADRTYRVYRNGGIVGSFTPTDPQLTLAAGRTGSVSVLTKADVGLIRSVRGLFADDGPAEYQLSLPKAASEFAADEEIAVTASSPTVSPIAEAGPDHTVISLGGASLPHVSERPSNVGAWEVRDGVLYYTVGDDPPPSSTLAVAAGVPTRREIMDDASRITSIFE